LNLILFSTEELEQIAAPVALYPDPLLAQVLMAATYPVEVVQAARFVQAHPTLKDRQLDEALRAQNWDDSVKALAQFPQILAMMDDKLDWTQRLGDAFLAQEQDLMDAVQVLRARAQAQGTLTSSPQQVVRVQAPYIYIEPASPQVIYVPVYNPLIVYGPWPYPAHRPYYYYPVGWPVARGFSIIRSSRRSTAWPGSRCARTSPAPSRQRRTMCRSSGCCTTTRSRAGCLTGCAVGRRG